MSPASACSATCWRSARGAGLAAAVEWAGVPLLAGVSVARRTGLCHRRLGPQLGGLRLRRHTARFSDVQKALLTDPQTSGGLLVACAPAAVDAVLATFRAEGFDRAAVIGELGEGSGITVVG